MIAEDEIRNYEEFRDSISELLISRLSTSIEKTKKKRATKGRKNEIKPVSRPLQDENEDAIELAETIEYITTEIFTALPADLRTLSHTDLQNSSLTIERYGTPLDSTVYAELLHMIPLSVTDSLVSFGVLSNPDDLPRLLENVFATYVTNSIASPPEFTPTFRATECEICGREHLPLTYHHLIPRAVHTKAVKRGWHASWELQKVAWLCRACHSFVHRIATNEELAKELYSVERLLERDDVLKWAAWVSRIRWKSR